MSRALERILRIRRQAEEQARLLLERETQRLRQAQSLRLHLAEQVHAQREHLTQSFVADSRTSGAQGSGVGPSAAHGGDGDWLLAEAALEFSSWSRMQLEQWCVQEAERVAPLAEAYQERRKELRQVERLVERQRAVERTELDRREQAEADSWFQIETERRRRQTRRQDASAANTIEIRTANDF